MNLTEIFNANKIDYNKFGLFQKNCYLAEKYDISVIIPVRGRVHLQECVLNGLLASAAKSTLSIAITFVEQSLSPEFDKLETCSYIHIPCNDEEPFNKCLCMNIGFIYGPKANFYLFHDSDLLCSETFFSSIEATFNKNFHAIQCFKKRRVIYASEYLTDIIIKEETPAGVLDENHPNVQIGTEGAPGGSLLVSRYFFILIGGYDPEYFTEYSIEDQFFHDKLSLLAEVFSLNSENLIHLFHHTLGVTKQCDFDIYHEWKELTDHQKLYLIELKSNHLEKFLL
jgi:hypothetical protein